MTRVNDVPDNPLTPDEIKQWRKEQELKAMTKELHIKHQKALKEWMDFRLPDEKFNKMSKEEQKKHHEEEGKLVKKFNNLGFQIALTEQQLSKL